MSGEQPSDKQRQAKSAQSLADQTGRGKERASKLQSEADLAALLKHGQ
ncbi:hypothetical protein [Paenibacillus beijingensis]|nr:hypothetical protein [Paenibacillus beijingensis]